MDPRIVEKTARFPEGPGVYVFLGADGRTLYAGKASNLRARVRSYLRPGGDGRLLLRFLEHEAADVDFVATASEQEALLLENTVIKKRKPPYNIKLKDDKSFLMLRLDLEEPWPWYRLVRRRRDDGASYFGPYPSAKHVRRTLRLLHKVVPLRDCADAVFDNRSRPCIKHQIGRCPAPCVGLVDRAAYEEALQRSMRLLQGETGQLQRDLRAQMALAAERLEFERAQVLKLQLDALSHISQRQSVVSGDGDEDALGLHRAGAAVSIALLSFRDGALEQCRRFAFQSELPDDLLLSDLLVRLYEGDVHVPRRVLLPTMPAEAGLIEPWLRHKRGGAIELLVPQRGARRRFLALAQQNAELAERVAASAEARAQLGAERLAEILSLPEAPQRLHCIDVSTTQGRETVASRVCFVDGKPDKSQYRKFRISEAAQGDDFSAMEEAVRRSLSLCLSKEREELPDLLVVDGGKGQLQAAQRALSDLGLLEEVPVCGLAKSRLRGEGDHKRQTDERIFMPGRELPTPLPDGSPAMLLCAALRDEAHRFAITYHRKRRSRITSSLDELAGVGPSRRRQLLQRFGSMSGLRAASLEELRAVPGLPRAVAEAVFERLRAGREGGQDPGDEPDGRTD